LPEKKTASFSLNRLKTNPSRREMLREPHSGWELEHFWRIVLERLLTDTVAHFRPVVKDELEIERETREMDLASREEAVQ